MGAERAVMDSSTDLVAVKLDTARLALVEAKTIQDAKRIADIPPI
jgi:hypothetical protein